LFVCLFIYDVFLYLPFCIYQVRSVESQQRVARRIAQTMELKKNLIKGRMQDFADKQARTEQKKAQFAAVQRHHAVLRKKV